MHHTNFHQVGADMGGNGQMTPSTDCCYPSDAWQYNGITPMKQIEGKFLNFGF